MPHTPIRVLIVDDHPMVRRGLAAFLRSKPDLELAGEAANGGEAITHRSPTEILTEIAALDAGGAEVLARVIKLL